MQTLEKESLREKLYWTWNDFKNDSVVQFSAMTVVFVLVIAVLSTICMYVFSRPSCFAETNDIGYPARWTFWGGCQIQVEPDSWIPLENYTYIDTATE